jgi:hypothetical protein
MLPPLPYVRYASSAAALHTAADTAGPLSIDEEGVLEGEKGTLGSAKDSPFEWPPFKSLNFDNPSLEKHIFKR